MEVFSFLVHPSFLLPFSFLFLSLDVVFFFFFLFGLTYHCGMSSDWLRLSKVSEGAASDWGQGVGG